MQRLVILSAYVNEYPEQFVVHILAVVSEAYVPFGQVLTQNNVFKSAYDSGSDGHLATHF